MIAIILSEFNQKVMDGLLEGCMISLKENGYINEQIDIYHVPGAFEIPAKIKLLKKSSNGYKCIIALGCIIKGETDHYHYISEAVTNGIMSTTLDIEEENTSVIFGVLTCQNKELAYARSNQNLDKNKGYEAGMAAIKILKN
ncbi:MAG: 6,7-dimethyl-8-ribityllumazine synthase [Candidatus Neomarinimicrobiota bacterium]